MAIRSIFSIVFLLIIPALAYSASLTRVSDLVSTSAPSLSATHTINLRVTNDIPASGRIVITPQPGAFSIPSGFDYQDVDVLVSSGGPFSERTLAASPSATEDGVSAVTGTSGSITISLNSSSGVTAGDDVRIEIGTIATNGGVGDTNITNPSAPGSYRISLVTYDASLARIDDAGTRVAIIQPVVASVITFENPPILSDGLPSGALSHGNSSIELSLSTNEAANCRYATTTGMTYGSMTNSFTYSGSTLHTVVVSGHQNGGSYSYYVRCQDQNGTANSTDYEIAFSINSTPTVLVSTGVVGGTSNETTSGSNGSGGVGSFPGGSALLFLSSVNLSGVTSPSATVYFLKDGVAAGNVQADSKGSFTGSVANLERGSYTFAVYAGDSKGRKTSLITSTITVGQGSTNTISGLVLPPTLSLSTSTVDPGDIALIQGEGKPGSTVEILVKPEGGGALQNTRTFTAPIGALGLGSVGVWEHAINTSGFDIGTYEIRARIKSEGAELNPYSNIALLGVGEAPSLDTASRSDINGDGKVNLTDVSIMLSFWGTPRSDADLNLDGTIGLADFSILLFNWTG